MRYNMTMEGSENHLTLLLTVLNTSEKGSNGPPYDYIALKSSFYLDFDKLRAM